MSATYDLFVRWRTARGHDTDNAGAVALGENRQTVSNWKQGRNGSAGVIERMANDLGEDPVLVFMQAFAETATREDDRKALRRMVKRLGAASVAGLVLLAGTLPAPSYAATGGESAHPERYIMRTVKRRRRTAKPDQLDPGTFPDSQPPGGRPPCRTFCDRSRRGYPALHHPRSTPQPLRPRALRARSERTRRPHSCVVRLALAR